MMHPQHGCQVRHSRATRTSFPRLGSRLSQRARWERATTCCLHSQWCLRPQVFYHHKYQVLCQLYFSMRKSYLVMSQFLWTRPILYTPKIQLSEVHICCFDSHWYLILDDPEQILYTHLIQFQNVHKLRIHIQCQCNGPLYVIDIMCITIIIIITTSHNRSPRKWDCTSQPRNYDLLCISYRSQRDIWHWEPALGIVLQK